MRTIRSFILPALAALAASGCGSSTGLADAAKLRPLATLPTPDAVHVAQQVPGFGGYFIDEDDRPAIYLVDPAMAAAAVVALDNFFRSRGLSPADLRVLQGRYDALQLDAWHRLAYPQVFRIEGAVFSDVDESVNRLRFGMSTDDGVAQARTTVAALGVPEDAYIVDKTQPIELPTPESQAGLGATEPQARSQTLDGSRFRPVMGGIQINFFFDLPVRPASLLCTLGFNAYANGERSYITNSHCSNHEGDGGASSPVATRYFQPTIDSGNNYIAREASDPEPSTNLENPDCPAPYTCRYSDASRAVYDESVESAFARIARPKERDQYVGTMTVDPERPTFTVIGKRLTSVMGDKVNKVGRTTGWTFGRVTGTCQNSLPRGSTVMRLCSDRVDGGSDQGDSGSPVFALAKDTLETDEVVLVGINWGGVSDGRTMIFSPFAGIEKDLGELTVNE
jgi:hypothetical protein